MTRKDFEAWASNYPWILADAQWHEDERRYTVMSSAQVLWEAWQAAAKLQRAKDAGICSKRAESLRAHNDKSLEGMINTADGLADAILAQGEEYGHR